MAYLEEKGINKPETDDSQPTEKKYKDIIKWRTVGIFVYIHLGALYGAYLMINEAKSQTIIWSKYIFFINKDHNLYWVQI